MIAAVPSIFPGSRALGGWWRQLAPFRPRALWVTHLRLHRVEALVRLTRTCQPDPLDMLLLDALAMESNQSSEHMDRRLHLGPQAVGRLLHGLAAHGLARRDPEGAWACTALGEQAFRQREYPSSSVERRAFHFVENGPRAPHFLRLGAPGLPCPAPPGWTFDSRDLKECLRRPDDWKRRHGFPLEVNEILDVKAVSSEGTGDAGRGAGSAADSEFPPWQRIIVDCPEQLSAVVVLAAAAAGGDRLLGFAVEPKNWLLDPAKPAIDLDSNWREAFADLAEDPAPERWQEAWKAWGQSNGLSAAEVDSCRLERRGHRLQVWAPRAALGRLRKSRSDALKGEAWLLAGDDRRRAAASLEILSSP
jgi:hypothetical protein